MENGIELKKIDKDDLEFVRQLRNLYRDCFFNDKIITSNEQINWFENYLHPNYIAFYIIWNKNERIGTISLKKHNTLTNPLTKKKLVVNCKTEYFIEISNLAITPSLTQKGIMCQAINYIMNKPCIYIAFVKNNNIKSANLFRKLNFKEISEDGCIFFQKLGSNNAVL